MKHEDGIRLNAMLSVERIVNDCLIREEYSNVPHGQGSMLKSYLNILKRSVQKLNGAIDIKGDIKNDIKEPSSWVVITRGFFNYRCKRWISNIERYLCMDSKILDNAYWSNDDKKVVGVSELEIDLAYMGTNLKKIDDLYLKLNKYFYSNVRV